MSKTLPGDLAARMATSAHGWGAVIDGVLNIRSVTDSRKWAALNALHLCGVNVLGSCQDPECDCTEKALAMIRPDVKLVPVICEVGGK